MIVKITYKDMFFDIIMLIAALLIVMQKDETGYMLMSDFKGLTAAFIILIILPTYHTMLWAHAIIQSALDYLETH